MINLSRLVYRVQPVKQIFNRGRRRRDMRDRQEKFAEHLEKQRKKGGNAYRTNRH